MKIQQEKLQERTVEMVEDIQKWHWLAKIKQEKC